MALPRFMTPWPVLGHLDDVEAEFNADCFNEIGDDDVLKLTVANLGTSDRSIEQLLSSKSAEYVIRVECPKTFFRQVWTATDRQVLLKIPARRLRGRVHIRVRVCTGRPLVKYRPDKIHEDYGGAVWELERGSIIAAQDNFSFHIELENEPLADHLSSIMRIACDDEGNKEGPFRVTYDNEEIIIYLSQRDHESYSRLERTHREIVYSAIILPALEGALRRVLENQEGLNERYLELRNLNWHSQLEELLKQRHIKLESETLLENAQVLLSNCNRRLFAAFEEESNEQ